MKRQPNRRIQYFLFFLTHVFITAATKGLFLAGGETVFELPKQSRGFGFGLDEPWVVSGAACVPFIFHSVHHTARARLSSSNHDLPLTCFL